jgi:hypothetical protein
MMNSRTACIILLGAAAMASGVVPGRAQVRTSAIIKIKPVRTHEAKPPKARFEVLNMMTTGIQVRSVTNGNEVRTFLFAEPIRERMQNMVAKGTGYQYGDRVEIEYEPGTQVALKIKGKPSKPL